MGVSTRHKTPSPRQFLLGGSNIQKRSRQDTHQPSNFTRPAKHSRKDVDDPSLARNEEVEVEDAPSDMDEDDDYHGSGAVTLKTLVGPLTVDARVAIAVQHLLFDGPEHPLYAGHLDAIISQCDGQSIAESGCQLQRMCEFIHAQASELNMVPKGSQSEEEVRTVWAKEQGQALAEQIKGTSAFPDVIAAMVMEEAQHHSSSDRVKDILRAVEDRCDKQAQAPVMEESVPQDSAGLDEHLALPYRPDTDAPAARVAKPDATYKPLSATFCQPFGAPTTAAVVSKPDATYRPLSAAFCQPFGAALHQASSAGSATEQAPKTGPTAGSTGLDRGGFSAASVAEKVLPSGPMSEATRSFPKSVSAFSTREPPKGRGLASFDREEPGQKQSTVQNSNGTGGSVNGRFGYSHPLHNWIVRPAVKVEESEEDGDEIASPTSADDALSGRKTPLHALEQTVPSDCIVLGPLKFKKKKDRVTNALGSTFQPFGFMETRKLPGRRWLIRLGNSKAARDAASRTFKILNDDVKPKFYVDHQTFIATVPIDTSMSHLLTNISTLYKKSFSLQYSDQSPFSLIMVLILSERILAKNFKLKTGKNHSGRTAQFSSEKLVPAGRLHVVQALPLAQPYHFNRPPTAV
ncbi:hypothetical protein KC315_g9481 [Hortaea werneckii]|nr:hypothetical protein KC315_g9481 [Hortaea werneckii]